MTEARAREIWTEHFKPGVAFQDVGPNAILAAVNEALEDQADWEAHWRRASDEARSLREALDEIDVENEAAPFGHRSGRIKDIIRQNTGGRGEVTKDTVMANGIIRLEQERDSLQAKLAAAEQQSAKWLALIQDTGHTDAATVADLSPLIENGKMYGFKCDQLAEAEQRAERAEAERDAAVARCAGYREALDKLARLGNEPEFGNSKGNAIAQEALHIPDPADEFRAGFEANDKICTCGRYSDLCPVHQ